MRPIRNCKSGNLDTGVSKCHLDLAHVLGAIVVDHGTEFPADATASSLEQACHADSPNRFRPIMTFVEYAKEGGEPNVSSVGYGGNQVTGYSPRTDKFTMGEYDHALAAALSKAMNKKYDVFYFDENNVVYGIRDGEKLKGFPITTLYPTPTPHPTSSNPATLEVNFAFENARHAIEEADYIELDFDITGALMGLTPVTLTPTGTDNKYKLVETYGGYDVTAKYGSAIATSASSALDGVASANYDSATEVLTITLSQGATTPTLKAPSALYTAGIKGITG